MRLEGRTVVVIGASQGIGLATAQAAAAAGARVVLGGSTPARLAAAAATFGGKSATGLIDVTSEGSVAGFFADLDRIDHLFISAHSRRAIHTMKPVSALDLEEVRTAFEVKFYGMLRTVRCALPKLAPHGSITLVSGAAARRIIPGHAALSGLNAAVEAASRQLAKELAPIRVNVISPGMIRTSTYDDLPPGRRDAMFEERAKVLPVGRIGMPEDIAETALHIMCNGYMTGSIVEVDGGALLG